MRHLVKGKKLSRTASHRKATMQALSCALIKNKMIKTTVTKAKELRRFVEPLITKSKSDTTHNRRQAFAFLQDKKAVTILFNEIAPAVGDRPGGYTRVLKLGFRLGDSTEMALIELVDFSDYEPELKSDKKKKTRRAGKANKPTIEEADAAAKSSEKPKAKKKKESKPAESKEEKTNDDSTDVEDSNEDTSKAETKSEKEVNKENKKSSGKEEETDK